MVQLKLLLRIYVIAFIVFVLIGSLYAVNFKVFGITEEDKKKINKTIDDMLKTLDRIEEELQNKDNINNGTNPDKQEHHYYHHNFTITVKPTLPKVCGLFQMENGFYIEAQKMWCHTA